MKTAQHTRPHNKQTGAPTRALPKLLPTLLLALFFMMGGYGEVIGQVTVAEDDASNYSGWGGTNNQGGTGFSDWNFDPIGSAGFFIGNSTQGGRESINTGTDQSFGLFANGSGASASATRSFDYDGGEKMRPGDSFSFDISFRFASGRRAVDLWANADGTSFLFNLEHAGSDALTFFPNNSDARETLVSNIFNKAIRITITWNGGSSDNLTVQAESIADNSIDQTATTTIDSAPSAFTVLLSDNGDGGDGEPYFNSFQVTSDFAASPSSNASGISFTNVTDVAMDIDWTSGDGDGRIVVAREGSAVSFTPDNGTTYTPNADYSAAAEVGPTGEGNKVVYDGTGNSFNLTGLQSETTYHFAIYEYNDNGGTAAQTAYLTTDTPTANRSTEPVVFTSVQTGLWTESATWDQASAPATGDFVVIDANHTVTLNTNAETRDLTVNTNGELAFESNAGRQLTIQNGFGITNNGTFTANDGTVAFAGAGSITGTITFNNLDVSGAVDPGSAATVNGTLSLLSGGSVTTNSPAYGASSTLRYNTLATVNPGTEWPTGSTANPINVTIEGTNTQVSFGSDTSSRTIGGNLSIGAGATLQLSSAIGGDVEVAGNWDNAGTFDANGRAVFFEGGGSVQTVTNAQAGGIQIDFLFNNNTTGLSFNDDLTVTELTNNGPLDMNGNTIIFDGGSTLEGSTTITLNELEVSSGGITFTTVPTINQRFVINAGGFVANASNESALPDYGTGATLVYTGTFGVNDLASGWGTSGSKVPENVAVEGSGNLSLNIARGVSGEVNVGSGTTLNANGNLTIESGAFLLNDGTINGDIIFEREITDHSRWVSFTSPVANSLIADTGGLFDALWTQGFPDSDDPGAVGSSANVLVFNENEPGTDNDRFSAPLSNTMVTGKGYFIYVYEQKDRDDPATALIFPLTVSTQGSENPVVDPFTFNLTYTAGNGDGWNLLGNPYGASLDWADTGWGKTNIDDFAYLWNPATGNYQVTSGGNTGATRVEGITTSDHIAPFQAFFVKANASGPTLTVPSAARSTNADNAGLFNENPAPVFTLKLEAGESESFTGFRFGENYTEDFSRSDAYFLSPMASTFAYTYSLKQNRATMLNSLPLDLQEPVEFSVAAGAFVENAFYEGEASFSWPTFENIPADWIITLTDTQTGEVIDLKEQQSYSFQMSATGLKQEVGEVKSFRDLQEDSSPVMDTKFAGDRFILTIDPDGTSTSTPVDGELPAEIALKQNYPNPFNPATQIAYALPESSEVRLEVFNIQGQRVATLVDGRQNAGTHEVSFDAADLASGVYLYRLSVSGENGRNILTQKMTLLK